jgi:hypothetical protein
MYARITGTGAVYHAVGRPFAATHGRRCTGNQVAIYLIRTKVIFYLCIFPTRPERFKQNPLARLRIGPDVDTTQARYTQGSTYKTTKLPNVLATINQRTTKERNKSTMKTQTNTPAKPAKKLALSKQTIRVIATPQQPPQMFPTWDC